MRIRDLACPRCQARLCLDSGVWAIGSVRVRCVECGHYFLPPGSPGDRTVEDVTNASVPITVWEPTDAG